MHPQTPTTVSHSRLADQNDFALFRLHVFAINADFGFWCSRNSEGVGGECVVGGELVGGWGGGGVLVRPFLNE